MALELPTVKWWWWQSGRASGEGERVGEMGTGEGEGVRASGERGMWPTDLRRPGE